jgi:hypothetical protein
MNEVIDQYLREKAARPGEIVGCLSDGTVIRQAGEPTPKRLQTIGAAQLMAKGFERLHAPVAGLIVEGVTLLCGSSKIGKSWLVLDMCLAVASGRSFLGRKTERGQVLYLALEDSQRRLKSRIETLGEQPEDNLFFATQSRDMESGLLDDLNGWADGVDSPRMIVVDTLQKVRGSLPAKTNAYAADYAIMSKLKTFADARHIAVVLVHHLNKMRDVNDPYDRISGSTGLMGAADTTILIVRDRKSENANVTFTGRDVWGDDFPIRMHNGRWSAVSLEAIELEEYESDPIVQTCKELLRQAFGGSVRISLQDFLDAAVRIRGTCVAATKNELSKKLEALTPKLLQYDGIVLSAGKRVGNERGLVLVCSKEV